MRKRNKIVIGGFGAITIIFMVVTGFILNGIIIKQSIEKQQMQNRITSLENEINYKINELATTLIISHEKIQNDFSSVSENLTLIEEKIKKINTENYGDFSKIIEKSMPSILNIRTLFMQGTGFIINENGYIVTNIHLLKNPMGETTQIIQAITPTGEIYSAEIIGESEDVDLALIKIEGNFSKLELGDSEKIQIGENVVAIGNPEGFTFSVTNGIISATKRIGPNNLSTYIQTNAELNQGNSGGPLINKEGKVIGMNNFKILDTEGMGFALESNTIKEKINQIYEQQFNKTLINY